MLAKTNKPPLKHILLGAGLIAALTGLAASSQAQIALLQDGNSKAAIDPYSQAGMYYWDVQGQNQLQKQWFWYGIGNGAVASIDTIGAPVITPIGANELSATYTSLGNFSVSIDYKLTGGSTVSAGQYANADIAETIKIVNLSAAALPFHFYQYSYFNLNGGSSDTVQLGVNVRGLYNDALQSNPNDSLSETVTTPGANHGEVGLYNNGVGDTLAKLNSGAAVTLGAPFGAGPVGPGAVTWALEWNFLNGTAIAPGGSAIISKDKYLNVLVVPEPSTLALTGVGLAALLLRRRRAAR